MKIGMMQPYFFPYISYFQLLNMVDKYVVYDTAKFSNNKWGFRNRILINAFCGARRPLMRLTSAAMRNITAA